MNVVINPGLARPNEVSAILAQLAEAQELSASGDTLGAIISYRVLLHEPALPLIHDLHVKTLGDLGTMLCQQAIAGPVDERTSKLTEAIEFLEQARVLQRQRPRSTNTYALNLVAAYRHRHDCTGSGGDLMAANLILAGLPDGVQGRT